MAAKKKRPLSSLSGFAKRIEVRSLASLMGYLCPDYSLRDPEVRRFAERHWGQKYMNPLLLDGLYDLESGAVALQGLRLNLTLDPEGAQDSVPVVQLRGLSSTIRAAYVRAREGIEESPPTTRADLDRMVAELSAAAAKLREGWGRK